MLLESFAHAYITMVICSLTIRFPLPVRYLLGRGGMLSLHPHTHPQTGGGLGLLAKPVSPRLSEMLCLQNKGSMTEAVMNYQPPPRQVCAHTCTQHAYRHNTNTRPHSYIHMHLHILTDIAQTHMCSHTHICMHTSQQTRRTHAEVLI